MQKRTARIFKKLAALTLCASLCVSFAATAFAQETGEGQPVPVSTSTSAQAPTSTSTAAPAPASQSGSESTTPDSQPQTGGGGAGSDMTTTSGQPYVTAYTVTDAAGNEIQRITEGTKCRSS